MVSEAAVWAALADVQVPVVTVVIVYLGLVRSVRVVCASVSIGISLTWID
jgi:metal-sulfur cluster biosynthetic enzyme